MSKKHLYSIIGSILLTTSTAGLADINPEDVKISGQLLGIVNQLGQPGHNRAQFDFAGNINFQYAIQPELSTFLQLQASPGNGSLGFAGSTEGGNKVELTDIQLIYTPKNTPYEMTFGSFDTPFGENTYRLTNNADTFNNVLILNPLLYSAFAGQVGTLNTVGLMGKAKTKWADITVALSNGTNETAQNTNSEFETALSIGKDIFTDRLRLTASYMRSRDSQIGFDSSFSGWLTELFSTPFPNWQFNAHLGELRYDDADSSTKDKVAVTMAEVAYDTGTWFSALRYSGWIPENRNRDGVGVSPSIPNPGLALGTVPPDTQLHRLQIGYGYRFTPNLWAKAEYVIDSYQNQKNSNVNGIIVAINTRF